MLRNPDRCPECGCEEWSGYCGHFDCGACSLLRAEKDKINERYKELRNEK